MKNTYFQFKQFIIHQGKTSMKVCTDSCLFGAWVAKILEEKQMEPKNMLDIGTGTGLLSLMLAQKTTGSIDAIEINQSSFEEASANFSESKWPTRLQAHHVDLNDYGTNIKYDLIISNPPFFENDLMSNNSEKNLAKHDSGLTLENLLTKVTGMLTPNGYFAVLLPFHRIAQFIDLAQENEFYLQEKMLVKQTSSHAFFRGMLLFGWTEKLVIQKEITIKNTENEYSCNFTHLLNDYYLKL